MPGSGKTATGRILAKELSKDFSDTDDMIVKRTERAISTIFATLGEDYFRDLETEALLETIQKKDQVVATGGGIVLKDHNWELMGSSGTVIYLRTSPEVILERAEKSSARPLLETPDRSEKMKKILNLLERRAVLYERAPLICDTDKKTPQAVAEEIKGMIV